MKIKFIKMHGLGNDFAIFDARNELIELDSEQIRAIGDRRRGIGFDQMIIIYPPKSPETDTFFKIYNSDGSEVGACGNATRCVAKILAKDYKKQEVVMETVSGLLRADVFEERVSVNMGEPKVKHEEIPLSHEEDTLFLSLGLESLKNPVAVNVGNPHAVFFVDKVADIDLTSVGPKVENHEMFPEKVNVEIAEILSNSRIRMRVWERGCGITEACGTGACATAVAAVRRGLTDRKVTIVLDGGELEIEWRESDNHIIMTGSATEVYRGEIEIW